MKHPPLGTKWVSPSLDAELVRNIARLLPDLRLVLSIRNPVDRSWSQMKMFSLDPAVPRGGISGAALLRLFETRACVVRNDSEVWCWGADPHGDGVDNVV